MPAAAASGARSAILSVSDSTRDKERSWQAIINEVTDNNFQAEVLEADKPVLVDFWAPWCGPCRIVAPHLEELNGERDDLRVVKLNVDENPQTAAQYNVMSIPTLLLFKNGAGRAPDHRRAAEEPARAGARAGARLPRRAEPAALAARA